ncbi:Zinc finger and BTB domain-containing protein 41 [Myotis davidii]|uniref:Zinc finger and BTB domain-containing protein 41 n=1 Tax=Myotis davidii TaxID=225400 RepID=L5LG83_MYODS|nr:Zinc finger and BTB domain-containing protein 41 [Myotis davidii]
MKKRRKATLSLDDKIRLGCHRDPPEGHVAAGTRDPLTYAPRAAPRPASPEALRCYRDLPRPATPRRPETGLPGGSPLLPGPAPVPATASSASSSPRRRPRSAEAPELLAVPPQPAHLPERRPAEAAVLLRPAHHRGREGVQRPQGGGGRGQQLLPRVPEQEPQHGRGHPGPRPALGLPAPAGVPLHGRVLRVPVRDPPGPRGRQVPGHHRCGQGAQQRRRPPPPVPAPAPRAAAPGGVAEWVDRGEGVR